MPGHENMAAARKSDAKRVPVFKGSEDPYECFCWLQKAALWVKPDVGGDNEEKAITDLLFNMTGQRKVGCLT